MNILQAKKLVKWGYRVHRPVCFLAAPGVGKSQLIYQSSRELAESYDEPFGMIEIRSATSSPSELATVKYVDAGEVNDAEQKWVPTVERIQAGQMPARGFIFCDEIADGGKMTTSALQQLFLDRKNGNQHLAPGWYTVAASNRLKDKAAAGQLSRAFINRCCVRSLLPDADIFCDYGRENGFDYRLLTAVRYKPDCLLDGETLKRGVENEAFCSPRSMEIASDFLKDMQKDEEELRADMLKGTLGDGVGGMVNGIIDIIDDLPDLDAILLKPTEYPLHKKLDVVWATVGALTNRADPSNVTAIMQYFMRLPVELSTVAVQDLTKKEKSVYKTKEFRQWSTKTMKYSQ